MVREQPRKLSDLILPLPFSWMCTGKHTYTWTGWEVGVAGRSDPVPKAYVEWY